MESASRNAEKADLPAIAGNRNTKNVSNSRGASKNRNVSNRLLLEVFI